MANSQQELNLKINLEGAEEAADGLDKLNDGLGGVSENAENASNSQNNLSDAFASGIMKANLYERAMDLVVQGFQKYYDIAQRTSTATQAFNGQFGAAAPNIQQVSQRMNGLVSNIDLMNTATRASMAGLQLNEQSLGNLTLAATNYSRVSGQELTQTMEQLTEAISEGSVEQLNRFGIRITDTSSKAAIQRQALAQLQQQYANTTGQIRTASEAMAAFENHMTNAVGSFNETMTAAAGLDRTFQRLNETSIKIGEAYGSNMPADFDLSTAAAISFGIQIGAVGRQLSNIAEAYSNLVHGDFGTFAREIPYLINPVTGYANALQQVAEETGQVEAATRAMNDALRTTRELHNAVVLGNRIAGEVTRQTVVGSGGEQSGGGGGGGTRRPRTITDEGEKQQMLQRQAAAAEQERLENQIATDLAKQAVERERLRAMTQGEFEIEWRSYELTNQMGTVRNELIEEENRLRTEALTQATRLADAEARRNEILQDHIAKQKVADSERAAALKEQIAAQEHQESLQQMAMQTGQQLLGSAQQMVGMLIQSGQLKDKDGKLDKKARDEQRKQFLKNFAIQELFSGGSAAAEAIGLSFINPPAAAAKGAEAAYHFALAAAAGGGGAAIPKHGGGGGASKPSTKETKASGGGGGSEGSSQNIIVNVQGIPLLTEGQVGRSVQNALDAYQIRYGK